MQCSYTGQFRRGLAHGKGVITNYYDMIQYDGEFHSGFPDGQGIAVYKNGTLYIGTFLFGLKHGKGTLDSRAGEWYHGQLIQYDDECFTGCLTVLLSTIERLSVGLSSL